MEEIIGAIFDLLDVTNGYFWVVLGLVLVILEALGAGLAFVSLGLASILTGLLAFVGDYSFPTLLMVMGASSIVVFALSRPLTTRLHGKPTHTNVDALVGVTGIVTRHVGGPNHPGNVKVKGEEWRCLGGKGEAFDVETCVTIERVEGNTLYVSGPASRPCKEES